LSEVDQGWWFVPTKLNKFTVSPRNNLKANADGSVTLFGFRRLSQITQIPFDQVERYH
jgi:hypothetical protein